MQIRWCNAGAIVLATAAAPLAMSLYSVMFGSNE